MPYASIKIALADSQPLFRELITDYIQEASANRVVVSAGNGRDFIEKIEGMRVVPDICIIDIRLPVLNGYDTVQFLRKQYPEITILVLTEIETDYSISVMINMGVRGYLSKSCGKNDVIEAINSIHKQEYFCSKVANKEDFENARNNPYPRISKKEKQFLSLACTQLTFKEIAERMGIGTRGVETHHESLNKKFNLRHRADLTLFAIRSGLVFENCSSIY